MNNHINQFKNISIDDIMKIDYESNAEITNLVNLAKNKLKKSKYSKIDMNDEKNQIAFMQFVVILFSEKYPKVLIDENIILQIKREIYLKYLLFFD